MAQTLTTNFGDGSTAEFHLQPLSIWCDELDEPINAGGRNDTLPKRSTATSSQITRPAETPSHVDCPARSKQRRGEGMAQLIHHSKLSKVEEIMVTSWRDCWVTRLGCNLERLQEPRRPQSLATLAA